jgi:hypothetical protein
MKWAEEPIKATKRASTNDKKVMRERERERERPRHQVPTMAPMTPQMSFHTLNPAVRNFGTTPKRQIMPSSYHI